MPLGHAVAFSVAQAGCRKSMLTPLLKNRNTPKQQAMRAMLSILPDYVIVQNAVLGIQNMKKVAALSRMATPSSPLQEAKSSRLRVRLL